MQIKFKKLNSAAVTPKQGNPGDAGFDLTAINMAVILPDMVEFGTGIAVEIPPNHVGLIFPRSSIFRTGMMLTNAVGVIDSGYRGEIKAIFRLQKCGDVNDLYKLGDRIGQLVVVPIPEVEFVEVKTLSETARGNGGYGSTGR